MAIVGAGPHGLAVAVAILSRRPSLRDGGLVVLDPTGSWLTAWKDRFAALEIPCLRSPGVHHPDVQPHALLRYASATGRTNELADPFAVPSTTLFADFCAEVVDRRGLGELPVPATVADIASHPEGACVHLVDGRQVLARRVVLATNPSIPVLPGWAKEAGGRHAGEVDLRRVEQFGGQRVAVVGGGLTAAHLALGAARRCAQVTVVARRPLEQRAFDTDPGWLGPKELRSFAQERSVARRRDLVDAARGGGTIPARWLNALAEHPAITVVVNGNGKGGVKGNHPPVAEPAGEASAPDLVWYATGWAVDATTDPVLAPLRATHPTPVHRGIPELTPGLA